MEIIGRRFYLMDTAKQEVRYLIDKPPDDCTLEDVQYHLFIMEKIRRGIQRAESEGAIPQAEAEGWLAK
jgi:hypothetical protein